MGLIARLREGLSRTTAHFIQRFDQIARRAEGAGRQADPDTIDALEELLIAADIGVVATAQILDGVRRQSRVSGSLRDVVKGEIRSILDLAAASQMPPDLRPGSEEAGPRVTLVVGVNGTGKTTTVGKLANLHRAEGRHPLICAADTFRAAAVEQLAVWAARAGVDIVRAKGGADPAAVVYDAITAAKARGRDLVIVDTAGRLHTRVNLMAELGKIRRIASREVPGAPHEVLLVLDATVGQNGLAQAREFMGASGVTGVVLAKLDGTAKGGIAVAIAHDLKLPIRYVGVGEGIDDLLPFSPAAYVEALFDERWSSSD